MDPGVNPFRWVRAGRKDRPSGGVLPDRVFYAMREAEAPGQIGELLAAMVVLREWVSMQPTLRSAHATRGLLMEIAARARDAKVSRAEALDAVAAQFDLAEGMYAPVLDTVQ